MGTGVAIVNARTKSVANKLERIFMVNIPYGGLERPAAYQFGVIATTRRWVARTLRFLQMVGIPVSSNSLVNAGYLRHSTRITLFAKVLSSPKSAATGIKQ